jgi:hypothetical protein
VQAVQDPTGMDDLWDALRTALLLQVGCRGGYTKIVRGDNASTLAVRALSGVCKGVGFGLPASLQSIDTRCFANPVCLIAHSCTLTHVEHAIQGWVASL